MNAPTHELLDALLEAGRRMQAAAAADDDAGLERLVGERGLLLEALAPRLPLDPADPAVRRLGAAFAAQEGPLGDALAEWKARRETAHADAMQDLQRRRKAQRGYDAPPRSGILRSGLHG